MKIQLRLIILFISAEDLFIMADLLIFRENAADFVEAGFKKTWDVSGKFGLYKNRNYCQTTFYGD